MTRITPATTAKVLRQAKAVAYRDVYVPKNLRGKVEIRISPERVTIKKK
jgi:hypothetical protein